MEQTYCQGAIGAAERFREDKRMNRWLEQIENGHKWKKQLTVPIAASTCPTASITDI